MLGLFYYLLSFGIGFVFCTFAFPKLAQSTRKTYDGKKTGISPMFVLLPAWYVSGAMLLTWCTYLTAYLFRKKAEPLFYANFFVMPFFVLLVLAGLFLILKKKRTSLVNPFGTLRTSEWVFVVAVLFLSLLLMYWTFFVRAGKVYVGISVFSDFAPHLGMIRSFSYGNNFPTSYAHFAGEDIKYHFMFQFMVGNLEYLGMRIDHAFNLPSVTCFAGAFFLLYALAVRLTGRRGTGYIAALCFAFRSSDAFFDYLASIPKETDLYKTLHENMTFIGTTVHEDWGLWNLNVYVNQRHLAIGLCVLLVMIYVLLDDVFLAFSRIRGVLAEEEELLTEQDASDKLMLPEKAGIVLKHSLLSVSGWVPRNLPAAILGGFFLGMCCFFNGACVIACLSVLFLLAIVADHRLEYAITAVITTGMTLLAANFFIDGSAVSLKYYFGFLVQDATLFSAWEYVMTLCGILPFVLLGASVLANACKKWILFAFTAPFLVAFTISMTVDVTVNHKYIMISLMLLAIPAASFVNWLWHRYGAWPKFVSLVLLFCLTVTGVYDFATVIKKNDARANGCLVLDQEDPITLWVKENATSQDIFLTSYYALNNFVMGGAMLYYGWPYYAWSAGYDTAKRQQDVREMYEAATPEALRQKVEACGIRYIVVDEDVRNSSEFQANEQNIKNTYAVVYSEGSIQIYDTRIPAGDAVGSAAKDSCEME